MRHFLIALYRIKNYPVICLILCILKFITYSTLRYISCPVEARPCLSAPSQSHTWQASWMKKGAGCQGPGTPLQESLIMLWAAWGQVSCLILLSAYRSPETVNWKNVQLLNHRITLTQWIGMEYIRCALRGCCFVRKHDFNNLKKNWRHFWHLAIFQTNLTSKIIHKAQSNSCYQL